ncbi:hypothetical protein A2291_05305 [candidate division WOR-1 bacterium RIFOXYB2_FULL_42_35]|uniref:Cell division protein FtsB n=1 Tax=candidate division WOR-1 bacterium RIFOXYC2_FULL_41_25 TaxID=1802586 RepID=A0A1F4TLQ7_UNCSA|nr:MAG: hypothetical protein A2247_08705 [candidate division WOR-1 bacterium RIFOXYA2_FULL_41_14]OGC23718.1 MAG: hypothetical protein A2291_05305 [candidate division WOR-1 bacterium RIFOXYB2_FULL_42_35]OGC33671.1 MAG: hypothetical protein A2462_02395 [candidate division WOR-1 bacterium RIFOXYC2_FULL_41_25]OGC43846.1 MAG: hypothetical protein A2548_00800 [candidate division WOR-1 bacterium RIFOXYD2_FULL_41_8]
MKRLGWLLFVLVIVYFIFLIRQDIIGNLDLRREFRVAQQNTVKEEQRSRKLEDRLTDLSSNNYIEKLARTRLGLIKSGETAYKVIL